MKEKKSIMQILKKAYRIFVSCLAIILILSSLILFLFISFAKKDGDTPFVFGKSAVWIITDSMADEIPKNTCILLNKYEGEEINVGQIVTFVSEDPDIYGMLNTHRIESITEDGKYITKGDNNPIPDNLPVDKSQIKGIYKRKLTVATAFGRIINTPLGDVGLIALIIIAVAALCSNAFAAIISCKTKQQQHSREEMINAAVQVEIERLKREGMNKTE